MTLRYVAYIDEAGDEGLGKLKAGAAAQSKWLVIGGIIVTDSNDRLLPTWRDEIMDMFPAKRTRDLHFRKLNHDQKVAATAILSEKQLGICCVCSNKMTIVDDPKWYKRFKQKGYLYNYLTRYLLERITAAVQQAANRAKEDAELTVIFSRRGGTDYESMRDYMILMRDGREKIRPVRSIDWSVFSPDNIKVENHSRWAGLQIADVVTSATAAGLEPNIYGNYEPRYAQSMVKRYVARRREILDCGLTLIPPITTCPLDDAQKAFVLGMREGWRAPGP